MFAQAIVAKIFGRRDRNPVKRKKARKVWYLLFRVSSLRLPKFNFWVGDLTLGCLHPRFTFSWFGNLWGNSYTKFAILDNAFYFTCGYSCVYQSIVKFQNIMTMIVSRFSGCSLGFQWWFQFLEKNTHSV